MPDIKTDAVTVLIAATSAATSAPTASSEGVVSRARGGAIRTFVSYTGTVTAAVLRSYIRPPGQTAWFRGVSTTEAGYPLAPANGAQSWDWDVGEGTETYFVLESITQTGGGTVAVTATAVRR